MSLSVVPAQPQQFQQSIKLHAALPLGQLLVQAGLVSEDQVQLALQNQSIPGYEDFRIGEILALRGWIKQETCDFFAIRWNNILQSLKIKNKQKKIGYYLLEAGLLTEEQVTSILRIQQKNKKLFGQIAVTQGYLKQQTVDFFVKYLSSAKRNEIVRDDSLERAERYFKLRDLQGAMLELREVLRRDGNNGMAHAWLTRIYLEQGQESLAKVHLKQAIALSPNQKFVKDTKKQFFAAALPSTSKLRTEAKSAQRGSWLRFG
ncbi:hypothetical protein Lepto7376_0964 [[Leptolyngbya] sp. PCC 7376]|uniref:tetratricopeptide repeat protein n=1 Tax=[Leptolyngbya] sp. PCC 7376 TaxID=111781 RepID=UPI00029F3715|nr:hypothetical protein [[Leptolyngbya] sp. PCC 7376]AFY37337.1 hypothetical protein Lepto7376_0964 [[Leptolyngbya] sp. PCC 7376]